MQRLTAHFAGRVQGVGFRYATVHLARSVAVAGYVMNLPDGRVELVAEGEPKELQAFLAMIQQALGRNIRETSSDTGSATGEFGDPNDPKAFGMRY